jgi:GT2 family glycosyltransferase
LDPAADQAAGPAAGAAAAPPRLAAVVVTYNRRAQIRRTLARLLAEPCARVHVVDNGSTDGTREWLAAQDDPRLRLILPARNLGGAGGFEAGLRAAVAEDDPDWLVVMDDDARPEPGALAAFLALEQAGGLAGWDAAAAAVRLPRGRICEMNRPSRNPFWHARVFAQALRRGRRGFHLPDAAYTAENPAEIDAASFVGLFVSRAAIARAGYPDGRLFIYGDDVLYTLRLRRAGGRIGFFPGLRFEHDFTSLEDGSRVFRPMWKAYFHYRNLLFVYREAAGWLFFPALLLIVPKWILRARHYGAERAAYRRLLWQGLRDGILGRLAVPEGLVPASAPAPQPAPAPQAPS